MQYGENGCGSLECCGVRFPTRHDFFSLNSLRIEFTAPRCDNARGHGTKGMARLFLMFFPRRGVRLPAVSQSISTSGCCPLVRVGTATRPRNVRGVACSPGRGERRIRFWFFTRSNLAPPWRFDSARGLSITRSVRSFAVAVGVLSCYAAHSVPSSKQVRR